MVPSAGARASGEGDERAQTSTIGVALILGFAIAGSVLILALGLSAIGGGQDSLQKERAEKAMTQLDSEAALVALGNSDTREVNLPAKGDGSYEVRPNEGNMRITVENLSSGDTCTLIDRQLGSIVYEKGNTEIAYQGGGVWRHIGNGSLMVSPPEFHYRNGTLTLPIITVSGEESISNGVVISHGSTSQVYPGQNCKEEWGNPIANHKVKITVSSPYYLGWGQYFEERTTGGVTYDHQNNDVTLTLKKLAPGRTISEGFAVSGGSGEIQIQSGKNFVIDSYNSTSVPPDLGPPATEKPSTTGESNITLGLDVVFKGNARITGSLSTSGSVTFGGGNSGADGYVQYGQGDISPAECADHVGEWCAKNASVTPANRMDAEIQSTINDIESANDDGENNNDATDCIDSSQFTWDAPGCGDPAVIPAGDYYIDNQLQVPGGQVVELRAGDYYLNGKVQVDEKLILNTTQGDIRLALDNDAGVYGQQDDTNITVVGDGRVEIYSTGQAQFQKGVVWNRGYDARQFWLYCDHNCQVQITNGFLFNGVIYAPSGGSGGDQVKIENGQTEIYGSIVANGGGSTSTLKSNADIHFDSNLKRVRVIGERKTLPSIAYLHVTTNEIDITSG